MRLYNNYTTAGFELSDGYNCYKWKLFYKQFFKFPSKGLLVTNTRFEPRKKIS